MLLQNTKYTSYSERPNVIAMTMDVIGSMLSVPVEALRMPRFLAYTAIYVSELGQKLTRNEWHCYPVLVNNSWGYIPSFMQANHWS